MYCARALIVALFLALCASCVTDLPRYANPAQIERTALGLNSEDLILIDVVWGLEPESFLGSLRWKKHTELLISIPLVPGAGPPFWLIDPRHTQLSARQRLFRTGCSPQFLPEDRRQSEDLLLASDLPAGQGRQYSLRNVRRADGGVDLELWRRNETRSSDERVGFVPLPSEYTPPEVAPVWLYLAAPPLLVVDIASLAAGLVFVVVTTPILIVSIFTSAWE